MNADILLNYLAEPTAMPPQGNDILKNIITEYPFFQTAHLLYIKNLHNYKDLRYADQLKVAALYAADRSVLFSLIKKASIEHEVYSQLSNVVVKNELEENVVEPQKTTILEHTKNELEEIIQHRLEEIADEHQEIVVVENQEIETNDTQLVQDTESEIDMLDFDFDDAATKLEGHTSEKTRKFKNIRELEIQPQLIDYLYNFETPDTSANTETSDLDSKKQKQLSLIDNFLEKSPRIVNKHTQNNEPINDISQESVLEKEYMSETLAKIYLKQNNYLAAIKIYQKLSLKYPQKSAYFAEQINEIKNLSNNNK